MSATATSSSERYEAARKVLAEHGYRDAAPDDRGSIAQLTLALRSLIEPAATDDDPDLIAAQIIRDMPGHVNGEGLRVDVDDLTAGLVRAFHAGINAAWCSWEPETAPGVPSGTLEQLAASATEALAVIEESTTAEDMQDVFDARDEAGDVLARLVEFVKGRTDDDDA